MVKLVKNNMTSHRNLCKCESTLVVVVGTVIGILQRYPPCVLTRYSVTKLFQLLTTLEELNIIPSSSTRRWRRTGGLHYSLP